MELNETRTSSNPLTQEQALIRLVRASTYVKALGGDRLVAKEYAERILALQAREIVGKLSEITKLAFGSENYLSEWNDFKAALDGKCGEGSSPKCRKMTEMIGMIEEKCRRRSEDDCKRSKIISLVRDMMAGHLPTSAVSVKRMLELMTTEQLKNEHAFWSSPLGERLATFQANMAVKIVQVFKSFADTGYLKKLFSDIDLLKSRDVLCVSGLDLPTQPAKNRKN